MQHHRRISGMIAIFLLATIYPASFPAASLGGEVDNALALPVFSTGYDIRESVNDPADSGSVTYLVRTAFPATEVLEFYDGWFYGNGWIPAHEECQRRWTQEAQPTGPESIWRHISHWLNPSASLAARVVLEFERVEGARQDRLTVEGRVRRNRR